MRIAPLAAALFATLAVPAFAKFYAQTPSHGSPITEAGVVLKGADTNASGAIWFEQKHGHGNVKFWGHMSGLPSSVYRGMHIHSWGDIANGCASTGTHFNPLNHTHGAPHDHMRHVGDLGNVWADDHGEVRLLGEDHLISLNGPLSIVGRAVVVHMDIDDLGRGGNADTKTTGNAGGRLLCGVIGIVST